MPSSESIEIYTHKLSSIYALSWCCVHPSNACLGSEVNDAISPWKKHLHNDHHPSFFDMRNVMFCWWPFPHNRGLPLDTFDIAFIYLLTQLTFSSLPHYIQNYCKFCGLHMLYICSCLVGGCLNLSVYNLFYCLLSLQSGDHDSVIIKEAILGIPRI